MWVLELVPDLLLQTRHNLGRLLMSQCMSPLTCFTLQHNNFTIIIVLGYAYWTHHPRPCQPRMFHGRATRSPIFISQANVYSDATNVDETILCHTLSEILQPSLFRYSALTNWTFSQQTVCWTQFAPTPPKGEQLTPMRGPAAEPARPRRPPRKFAVLLLDYE